MAFAQFVIGPPGSGKTTYCDGMQQFLTLIGRKVAVVNLDPANDRLPYECAVSIDDLVTLDDVMNQHQLGPNGGMVFCMEYLEKNVDWLLAKLRPLVKSGSYFLFDLPGQVELFVHNVSVQNILQCLEKELHLRIAVVQLVDSHLCADPPKYLSALLVSLSSMLHLGLPQVNVLSKADLVEAYGKLDFNLDFYTEVQDLTFLQLRMKKDPLNDRYRKLTSRLCDVIQDFSLVGFETLDIQDKESVARLVDVIDTCNGYVYRSRDLSQLQANLGTSQRPP